MSHDSWEVGELYRVLDSLSETDTRLVLAMVALDGGPGEVAFRDAVAGLFGVRGRRAADG